MRPRFVLVVAAAAVVASIFAVARWPAMLGDVAYRRELIGFDLVGTPARALAVLEPLLFLATAAGLWLMQPWARLVAMGYLAYVIAAFLFFGVGPSDGRRATAVMLWQVSVVPFATFCFMFLYNGARYFRPRRDRTTPAHATLEPRNDRVTSR